MTERLLEGRASQTSVKARRRRPDTSPIPKPLLDRFQRLRADGKVHDALALWRGPPLADFAYEGWAQTEIARLEEPRMTVLEERVEADLALGRGAELVAELEALVALHPLRERLRAQLMLALYRSGRRAEALEVHRETTSRLVEELGIEPGPALQELNRAILAQDRGLEAAPRERPVSSPERAEAQPHRYSTSFVGRKRERREATELAPSFGHGAVVVDLTPISDPERVAPTIAGRLGLRESPGRRAVEALAAFLRGRETLLLLAGENGLRALRRERRRRRRALRPPRRPSARARAGGGSGQAAVAARDRRPARPAARPVESRSPGRARAAPHAPRRDRVELPPPRRARAAAVHEPRDLHRRLHAGRCRGGRGDARRRRPRGCRVAARQQPSPATRDGGRRARFGILETIREYAAERLAKRSDAEIVDSISDG